MRVGNAAHDQQQHGIWGAVLDSVCGHTRSRVRLDERLWPILSRQVKTPLTRWREPHRGIWEVRGEPQHFTSSKVMCCVAADCGARLARMRDELDSAGRWSKGRRRDPRRFCANAIEARGVFTQHYWADPLDASVLLVLLVRFLPATDPRVRATVLAVADELCVDRLMLPYRPAETDDDMGGHERAPSRAARPAGLRAVEIGEHRRARELCERLLGHDRPLGL